LVVGCWLLGCWVVGLLGCWVVGLLNAKLKNQDHIQINFNEDTEILDLV
jgi:hypothetical protein